ncbi:MAG: YihY/virulence factor BrkB family protein [Mycobacteriaceae bacterium]|uniref:YihY/virulence factor BrkB family protein n=1 Tax=Corynebacterium sp. TaxID=1720 RepID=UPI003F9B15E6
MADTTPSSGSSGADDQAPALWRYLPTRAFRQFTANGCMDFAASLTFRTLLALFPALIALVAILGLFGQDQESITDTLNEVEAVTPDDAWGTIGPIVEEVLTSQGAGVGLGIGLVITLWTASGYVRTFSRAMNAIYGVEEGRGPIKKNLQMYLLTVFLLVMAALGVIALGLSGPVAETLGSLVGLGDTVLGIWGVARWVVIALVVVGVVGLLYRVTPNIRTQGMRWFSVGALTAIIGVVVSTLVFFFYVSNFANFGATYGALASVIVLMLWVYIINILLLVGAVLDCEVERIRQLRAGLPAEESLQLDARDTSASDKLEEQMALDVERARSVRFAAVTPDTEAPDTEEET